MSDDTNRISLNKGYTKEGFADKVFHIHLRYTGDNDELYFRDYLNQYPQVAKDYESLKLELWKKYCRFVNHFGHDRKKELLWEKATSKAA